VRPDSEPAVDRVPEDFIHLVQDALGHLHDPSHLQTHPLTRLTPNQEGAGRALRARLLAAVEKLRPAREGEQLGRAYQILRLRYVEGLTPRQVQDRLGVAKSQYYLDSARAVAALASLVWEELGPVAPERQATLAVTPTVGSHVARPWTSFVGRERELEQLLELLSGSGSASRPRLVTLVGPGGVGKTRLALECAAALQWRDGVPLCFVELASLHDPSLVLPTLATTLGLQEVAGRPLLDVLNEHLSEAELLLILDNLEHVIGVANDIAQLLRGCPHLQVLATSRMPLNVYGEQEVVVPPLATGQSNRAALEPGPAERLFIDRSRAVKPEYALTSENAGVVAEICARLDGLPLAIELAAAWTRVLSPAALLRQLDQRLAILIRGPSNLPVRQQTLRATIDWSFELLPPTEQVLFRRLAVFSAGFRLEAATAVVTSAPLNPGTSLLEGLTALVAKNLVRQDPEPDPDGGLRFRLLETIREYALERLEASRETVALQERHARFFLHLSQNAEPRLTGPDQALWLERLERSLDNLRVALEWWLEHEPSTGLQMAVSLGRLWLVRGYLTEGRTWFSRLLARTPATMDLILRAQALEVLARLARVQGDFTMAGSLHAESLAIMRAHAEPRAVARAIFETGVTLFYQGELAASQPLFVESLAMARESGDSAIAGQALFRLANLAHLRSEFSESRRLHLEALELLRRVGDRRAVADSLFNLGYVAADDGDLVTARAYLDESLVLMNELGDPRGLAWALEGFAQVAAPSQPERAVRLAGAAERLRDDAGVRMPSTATARFERVLAPVRLRLSADTWAAEWEAGRSMGLDEALAEARGTEC
jgi:predicted ATPase